jgi:hypothetical protein
MLLTTLRLNPGSVLCGIYGGQSGTSIVTRHNHSTNASYAFNHSFVCHGRCTVLATDNIAIAHGLSVCMNHSRMGKSIVTKSDIREVYEKV